MPLTSAQHGYYRVEMRPPMLIVTIAEGINRELVEQYQDEVAQLIPQLAGAPWGVYLRIEGDVLMTPEATAALIATTRQHVALGRCATAIRLIHPGASALLHSFWSNIYLSSGIRCHFCASDNEAEHWLSTQISHAGEAAGIDSMAR